MNESTETAFAVVVSFNSSPETRAQARQLLDEYIDTFLSRQPGFIQSWLHQGNDGSLLHYAQWRDEADFRAFAAKAATHPLLPAIRELNPSARTFQVCESYPRGS